MSTPTKGSSRRFGGCYSQRFKPNLLDKINLKKPNCFILNKKFMLNNIKNAAGLMANANKVRQQQQKISALLASIRVSGTSKNSRVTVTITGEQKIVDIQIDPSLVNFVYENYTSVGKADSVLSKSIIEAVEDAISKVQKEIAKKMQETGSMGDFMSMVQAVSQGGDQ